MGGVFKVNGMLLKRERPVRSLREERGGMEGEGDMRRGGRRDKEGGKREGMEERGGRVDGKLEMRKKGND